MRNQWLNRGTVFRGSLPHPVVVGRTGPRPGILFQISDAGRGTATGLRSMSGGGLEACYAEDRSQHTRRQSHVTRRKCRHCQCPVSRDGEPSLLHRPEDQSKCPPSSVPRATINARRSSVGRENATSKGTPFLIRYKQSIRSGCLASFPTYPRQNFPTQRAARRRHPVRRLPTDPPAPRFAAR